LRLEEEIKQESFDDEFMKVVVNVLVTADRMSGKINQTLKPYGISKEQFNALRILRGQFPKPSPLQLVSERMISKNSNATRLVEKLRQKGLVERSECESNRRQVDILITKAGLDLLKTIDPVMRKSGNEWQTISEAEAKKLNRLLDKIRE